MTTAMIFDMDGTLFQTNKILEISLEETFNVLRGKNIWDKETPIKKYQEIMGVPLPVVWETLLPKHSLEIREQTNEIFHKKLISNIYEGNGALYPNVEEILSYLQNNNYPIYIASNGLSMYLQAIVEHYQLDRWVTETFSIQDIASQNKSDLVQSIINKYDIKKGAVIGDRLSDISAAKNNGLLAIGCKFDFSQEEELAQADEVVNDLLDIKEVVSRVYLEGVY